MYFLVKEIKAKIEKEKISTETIIENKVYFILQNSIFFLDFQSTTSQYPRKKKQKMGGVVGFDPTTRRATHKIINKKREWWWVSILRTGGSSYKVVAYVNAELRNFECSHVQGMGT